MHFIKPKETFTNQFLQIAETAPRICITAHLSPDPDSIASVLATYFLLTKKYPNKSIKMICTGEPINKYEMFKNFEKVEFVKDLTDHLNNFDLLIMLDGSQYNRFTETPDKIAKFNGKTICIDHHSSPIDKFDLSLVDPKMSSCSEIIYISFCKDNRIDKPLAEIFLLGILADTGNFTYLKPNQSNTLISAKKLIDAGQIEIQEFLARYNTIPQRVFYLLGELIKNTKYYAIEGWPDFQATYIGREFMDQNKFNDNEISEAGHIYMTHYLRVIENHTWGFVITPDANGDCSISLRSLPNGVSCRDVMEKMKIGGGHDRAAGGTFKTSSGKKLKVSDCLNQVLDWIKANKPIIR